VTEPAPENPATEQAAAGGEPKVSRDDAARAYMLGFTAGRTSKTVTDCPYPEKTPLAYHWLDGYMASQR
jgi:ribosome modulation factor